MAHTMLFMAARDMIKIGLVRAFSMDTRFANSIIDRNKNICNLLFYLYIQWLF